VQTVCLHISLSRIASTHACLPLKWPFEWPQLCVSETVVIYAPVEAISLWTVSDYECQFQAVTDPIHHQKRNPTIGLSFTSKFSLSCSQPPKDPVNFKKWSKSPRPALVNLKSIPHCIQQCAFLFFKTVLLWLNICLRPSMNGVCSAAIARSCAHIFWDCSFGFSCI